MRFRVIDAPQRSAEWFAARLGCLCASDAKAAFSFNKDKSESAARRDLRLRLVCERLTGRPADDPYTNDDMQRGIDLEAQARIAYEFQSGVSVRQVGFLRHAIPEVMAGCSPDGVIDDYVGLVELKCPRTARHVAYLRDGVIPVDYRPQLAHQMWITGAQYVDFVSFDPTLPERLQVYVARMHRDDKAMAEHEAKVMAFLGEVEREHTALVTLADPTGAFTAVGA